MKNVEIRKIKRIRGGWMCCEVAFNTVEFGTLVIKGFRVSTSIKDGGIWVQEPSFQVNGRYERCFFAEDAAVWNELKALLTETYKNSESSPESADESVSPDEIPEAIGTSTL